MAEDKKYFWLKLPTDFFKDRSMKKLKRMAAGPTYLVIYQKLLLLSLENGGNIYFEGIEDSFEDEMSLELDENVEDIQMTMLFLMKYNLIEQKNENHYFMCQVSEMIGSETDSARRKRKSRKNLSDVNETNSQLIGTMSHDVTNCPAIKEKEKEKEYINIDQNSEDENSQSSSDDQNLLNNFFESAWSKYPNKVGKTKVSITQKNKLYKLGDELFRCIERYLSDKDLEIHPKGWKKLQGGDRFFNKTYLEYTDKEFEQPKQEKKPVKSGKSWKDEIEVEEVYLNSCGGE